MEGERQIPPDRGEGPAQAGLLRVRRQRLPQARPLHPLPVGEEGLDGAELGGGGVRRLFPPPRPRPPPPPAQRSRMLWERRRWGPTPWPISSPPATRPTSKPASAARSA